MGPLVFKTSGAALGAARWVRLPCAPATEARCRRIVRVPPSVRGCSRRARPHVAAETDPDALIAVAREVVADERARLAAGEPRRRSSAWPTRSPPGSRLHRPARSGLVTVINATGVILHTNLGRAPWPAAAIAAAEAAAAGYSCSSSTASRAGAGRASGPRKAHLVALTGAEDALVTNNNAAALALAVGLAGRRGRGRVARRARRDRRRRPDPGDRPAGRRAAGRGRDDEPDPRRRLRGAARRRAGARGPARPPVELHARPGSSRRPIRPRSRASPTARGDRRRRPRLRRAARHRALRPGPRADARANGWRPARTS